ncbi:MAG: poly-beta-1,6-N-acetyl-D-glucosamine biosynthesis protein PgaD [Desulfobacteraceae bacterium]|nr:MAG: poly-beta-1,6-N-acetyl-D-glucosamine biosynthesis protein PgaD [Desulfobacteraceae bacterium]
MTALKNREMEEIDREKDLIRIIDNPGLRSVLRNIGELTFTSAMWALWVYLFFPIINIILWVLGIGNFYEKVIEHSDYLRLLELVRNCGGTVVGIFLVLWLWGFYNYHRFGKRNRRLDNQPVAPEKMAEFFDVPVDQVIAMSREKQIKWSSLYIPKQDRVRISHKKRFS